MKKDWLELWSCKGCSAEFGSREECVSRGSDNTDWNCCGPIGVAWVGEEEWV